MNFGIQLNVFQAARSTVWFYTFPRQKITLASYYSTDHVYWTWTVSILVTPVTKLYPCVHVVYLGYANSVLAPVPQDEAHQRTPCHNGLETYCMRTLFIINPSTPPRPTTSSYTSPLMSIASMLIQAHGIRGNSMSICTKEPTLRFA